MLSDLKLQLRTVKVKKEKKKEMKRQEIYRDGKKIKKQPHIRLQKVEKGRFLRTRETKKG